MSPSLRTAFLAVLAASFTQVHAKDADLDNKQSQPLRQYDARRGFKPSLTQENAALLGRSKPMVIRPLYATSSVASSTVLPTATYGSETVTGSYGTVSTTYGDAFCTNDPAPYMSSSYGSMSWETDSYLTSTHKHSSMTDHNMQATTTHSCHCPHHTTVSDPSDSYATSSSIYDEQMNATSSSTSSIDAESSVSDTTSYLDGLGTTTYGRSSSTGSYTTTAVFDFGHKAAAIIEANDNALCDQVNPDDYPTTMPVYPTKSDRYPTEPAYSTTLTYSQDPAYPTSIVYPTSAYPTSVYPTAYPTTVYPTSVYPTVYPTSVYPTAYPTTHPYYSTSDAYPITSGY